MNMNKHFEALKNLSEKGFAVVEWSLYLDTHPTDAQGIAAFRRATAEYKTAKESYENEYGPLAVTDTGVGPWIADPWPWDYEGCGC